jgi:hypothetical protein
VGAEPLGIGAALVSGWGTGEEGGAIVDAGGASAPRAHEARGSATSATAVQTVDAYLRSERARWSGVTRILLISSA